MGAPLTGGIEPSVGPRRARVFLGDEGRDSDKKGRRGQNRRINIWREAFMGGWLEGERKWGEGR